MNPEQQTGGNEDGAVVKPFRLRGEGCGDPYGITTGEQAVGIVELHKRCYPPCERKISAWAFLGMEIPEQGTRQTDGRGTG